MFKQAIGAMERKLSAIGIHWQQLACCAYQRLPGR